VVLPVKQGLKHDYWIIISRNVGGVEVVLPVKQGLKRMIESITIIACN